MSNDFLDQRGDYHSLIAFKKAECIYDITYHFAHRFLKIGDRTIDQMVQAARSGKQNLAEGYIDGVTSMEMMIKLINVNRGSLHELCLDYEDYLRVRNSTSTLLTTGSGYHVGVTRPSPISPLRSSTRKMSS